MKKLLKITAIITIVAFLGCIATAGFLYVKWYNVDIPSKDEIIHYKPPLVTEVYDRNHKLIGEFFLQRRIYVPIEKIPKKLKFAFLAAEDARFYQHKGIDLQGIIRALIADIKARRFVQGGSTITQQVAKNMFLTPKKTISRKIKEMILAMKIERILPKDKILELYLNQIYFGFGSYGVEAAAQTYFGKSVDQLTLAECALLAAIPKSPGKYSPLINIEAAYKRRNWVLKRMLEEHFITKKEYEKAINEPIILSKERIRRVNLTPYFNEFIRRKLIEKYGEKAVLTGGLKVFTTIDYELQKKAEEALKKGIIAIEKREKYINPEQPTEFVTAKVKKVSDDGITVAYKEKEYFIPQDELEYLSLEEGKEIRIWFDQKGKAHVWRYIGLEGGLLSVDLNTMGIVAMVGGYDYSISKFNRTYQAKRQPGSAFKPIVYTAAIESGYTPFTIVLDAPVLYENPKASTEEQKYWIPRNYEGDYLGPIPLWKALALSRNTVSVRLADSIGISKVIEVARRLGITSNLRRDLSLALGSSEVSLWELLRAYTVFAREGNLCELRYISKVVDKEGKTIYENEKPLCINVLDNSTVDNMLFMLRKVVEVGTGRRALALKRPAAGKTGTTNEFRDAWFLGFTPNIATGVYVGFDDHKSIGKKETGARAALPIWVSYMKEAVKKYPLKMFPPYTELITPPKNEPQNQEDMEDEF